MIKKRRILFQVILITAVAWLALATAGQAAYNYHKTVTVDHTRVGLGVLPPAGYGFVKRITVDNTKVSGTSNLVDFPVLVSIQNDATLKTTLNGGRVTDPEGDDIVFYASDLATRLDYEVEQYDGATGTLVAWVRLPVLEFDADTVFYLAYGNSGISSSLANGPGVWDASFKAVYHLGEDVDDEQTSGTHIDSTGVNNGTQEGNVEGSGQIGDGQVFDGDNDYINIGNVLGSANVATVSAWVKHYNLTTTIERQIHFLDSMTIRHDGINSVGQLDFMLSTDGTYHHLRVNSALTANTWQYVAGTWDGTTQRLYLNGLEKVSQVPGGTFDSPTGGNISTGAETMNGIIDEVRISDTARSAGWIATEYNNQSDPGGFMTIADSGDGPLVDFPVLVSIQNDAQLKTTANGGQVTDAEGDDIIFSSDAVGAVQLDHEVESYDGATGSLVAWVRLPSLSVAEDTVFYLHYGNSAVGSSQQNAPGVWDAGFKGVWHLVEQVSDEQTSGTHYDSTGNNNDATQVGNDDVTGKIALGQYFDTGDNVVIGNIIDGTGNNVTVSAWVKHNDLTQTVQRYIELGDDVVLRKDGSAGSGTLDFYINTDGTHKFAKLQPALTTNGIWYYVVGTWDGTTLKVYLDGQEKKSETPGGTLTDPGDARISHPTETMNGVIDEVHVSNTARSAVWIATEYNNQQWPNKAEWPDLGFLTVQRAVCQNAVPINCGHTTAGSIEAPGAWDAFKVTIPSDTWLELYTTGTTDTYGHLYDGNCVEIAQDDTTNYNFNISQAVAAGTYYVQVRHASPSGTGDYELHVECSDDDHGDSIEDATALNCGQPVGGMIQPSDDVDYFKVVFWGHGILTAYTTGVLDSQGTLLDDAETTIGADDNSGASLNFKIVQSVLPGVYYVAVAGHNTGDYSLQVDCEYTPVITATAEYGGSISPSGAVGVTYGSNQSFTITPDAGNSIRDVWVDGVWVGEQSTYEFQNVQTDHKIVAVFDADFENCIDIPDIPLDAWYRSAPANVMFVLDDSGSMDWEFMTTDADGVFDGYYYYVFDDPGDNLYGRVLPDSRRMKWQSQWAGHNKLYYDPGVDYQPWPNHVANNPALTLAHANPDTPCSHPRHETPTFNLNATYYQYTSGTSAIIVNDQDSGFSKTPDAAGGQSLLSTGFEGADDAWDDGFDNNGTTQWNPDNVLQHSGNWSAWATKWEGGTLTSDDLDASDANSITVDFWFRKDDIENGEFILEYFNGTSYDTIADLDTLGNDDRWLHYQHTTSDSQYLKSNFRIQLKSTINGNGENLWVDDVVVTKTGGTAAWAAATGDSEAHNGDYWWTAGDGNYKATWTPDIPAAGDYDVYARWHAADNHSQNVPYTVNYATGSDTVTVDQRLNGAEWVQLGTYSFDAGTGGNVTITYTRSGDNDRVCADAVKFAPAGSVDEIDIIRAHYYVWSESEDKPYLVVLDGSIAYYAVNDTNGNNIIEPGEIATAPAPPADVKTGRNYVDERQNFADWYQFYRRRELSATAAVAKVIAGLKGVQVGLYSINGNVVQPAVPVKTSGLDKSKSLLQALYGLNLRAQGTPLRRGLKEVGKYFADSSKMIGSSPYATTANGGACQQAFAIVMTDGFWNGDSPRVGNTDGDDNTAFDGGGYADIYSNTLADVAMKYYENDLHTGLDNNVPTNAVDSATHQHMVTYAVSFGRVGSLNPADYDTAHGSYPVWPDPRYVSEHKIDDLWHAAVNGRGEFLNASNPTELVDSLLAISRSIESRIASSSSVSVNGDPLYKELDGNTRMYQATYRSDGWIGDVNAYQIDLDSGELATAPDWSAADRLEALDWNTGRLIATYDGSQGIPFRYDRAVLSADQQRALGSDLVAGSAAEQKAAKILNYVRGERTYEAQNSGTFRDRFQVLGDIVHSSPVYHDGNHDGMLYAGGNDGMLHAFDAASGDELFAYVPKLVFSNLSALVDPDYSHKYFVDLSPTIQDITLGGQAKTILVGGLGKGGRGYYALDVTNAENITSESELAARVLWEFPAPQSEGYLAFDNQTAPISVGDYIEKSDHSAIARVAAIHLAGGGSGVLELTNVFGSGSFQDGDDLYILGVKVAEAAGGLYDPYMGYSYSRPIIVKSNDPGYEWVVIFGNGYNSAKSHAVLYILNPATGDLIKKIDTGVASCNGLSSPIAIDVDSNHTADYVYAGDLLGNLWKFDLHETSAGNWDVAYNDPGGDPAPVFQAKNFSGHPQPITSKPDVMYHCSKPAGYMVTFGTGRYLAELDLESSETYSVYGIWDYGDDADDSEYLGSFERDAVPPNPQLLNPHLSGVASWARVKLLEQTVETGTWTTVDGQNLRVITDYPPNWGTVTDNDAGQNPNPGSVTSDTVHAGWYFDLPNAGEMAVSDVTIRDGNLLVISFTPGRDPCGSGGTSIFHAMNACSGGRPNNSVFVGINSVVSNGTTITKNSIDWKEITGVEFSGRLQPPVILRKGDLEFHYLSSSSGKVYKQETAATKLGIFYWIQVE
jgi:Tfp pilus tip-associated adhesin PilY1